MDIAVIGAGLGGLATATWLARAGDNVTIYERSAHPGGRARSTDQEGFRFNLGAHALYRDGAAWRHLEALGLSLSGVQPDLGGWLIREGSLSRLPATLGSGLTTGALSLRERLEYVRRFATVLVSEPDGSWEDWLAGCSPAVRDVFAALGRVVSYTHAPERLAASLVIRQLRKSLRGVLYLDHGWQDLTDRLVAAATDAGAVLQTRSAVTEVAPGRIVVQGVPVSVDAAVIALPLGAARRLVPELPSADPVEAAVLDVGLTSLPEPERPFVLGLDQPTYLSVHRAAGLSPEDGCSVQLLWYRAPGDTADHRADLEGLMDVAQPGWRDRLRTIRYLPRMVSTSAVPGAVGWGPQLGDGIWAVGDWVLDDDLLLDGVLESASRVATALSAHQAAA